METEINKDFIFNHFARKTSPLQRELIAAWLRDKAHEELYYEWLEEWETRHPQYVAQTELAYQRYTLFLEQNPGSDETPESVPLLADQPQWTRRSWLIAASILLLLCGYSFLGRDQLMYRTYETAYGETRTIRLPDGTTVLLNANSSLRVPRWGFGQNTREVRLSGEANFAVTHTPRHQKFVVRTDKNLDVVVLGTNFTVFARKRGTRVALNKGRVQLNYQQGNADREVVMKPGEQATFDQQNRMALNPIRHPETRPAWSEKRFVFDETPLREVAYMLEESYGLSVEITDPELAERVLIGSLRAENSDQLLQSISVLLDINVIRQGDRVQLLSH
ncbi:FecR family protein [Spirosoma rigui]|uniref:FecR family protein n=1 Tax=Spirosoma rigui TaxID=564064 RepID=UPI0009AF82D6|nr:FecR domain-containing protein [Spirosoma rigui]